MGNKMLNLLIETAVDEMIVDQIQRYVNGRGIYDTENGAKQTKRNNNTGTQAMPEGHWDPPIYSQHRVRYGSNGAHKVCQ